MSKAYYVGCTKCGRSREELKEAGRLGDFETWERCEDCLCPVEPLWEDGDKLYTYDVEGRHFVMTKEELENRRNRARGIPAEPVQNDPVEHPAHYTEGKIEAWDFIADQNLNYFRGCALKYIIRAGKKDPSREIEDLEKAVAYLNRELARLRENSGGKRETS